MLKRALVALLLAMLPAQSWGQQSVLQGGSYTAGILPMYSQSGGAQPIIQQSATAAGGPASIKEMSIVARGSGTAPYVGSGGGFLGSIFCAYDAPPTNATGGHQLCLSPDATGGFGLLSYNAFGSASALPFKMNINGTTLEFPFTTTGVVGPGSSVVNDVACWNNTSGTLLKDCGVQLSIGGTSGQIQYNNSGALGGFTMAGDCTLSQPNITCTKVNGQTINLGGTLTTGGAVTFSGAFSTTFTVGAASSVILPTTGTLATLSGAEAFTNKTYNGNTWTAGTGTLTIGNGKTLTASNTLTFSGTDGSTLNIGTGGTLGTAAYTAATAYMPSGVQITNSLSGNVTIAQSVYSTGPSVTQGSSGTWYASGTVTLSDSGGAAVFLCKLWDGTTVIASAGANSDATSAFISISLSGYLASPAGNIRISCTDTTSGSGSFLFNASGNSKDGTLSAFRVQ